MRAITLGAGIVIALGIVSAAPIAHAPTLDLGDCHDELDRLRRAASDASVAAEEGHSKREEFEDCKRDRDTYDLMGDGCRSRLSDYQSALSDLESKMDDLDSRLRSVQTSCAYEFTINRMSAMEASQHRLETAKRRLCTSLKTNQFRHDS
jgi:chromosome segregation ATPase